MTYHMRDMKTRAPAPAREESLGAALLALPFAALATALILCIAAMLTF